MGQAVAVAASNKRRKTETDYHLGIICHVRTQDEPLVENSQVQSIEIVLNLGRQRHSYADITVNDFVERTQDITTWAIHALGGSYYRSCYKKYSNKDKLACATRR